MSRETSADDRLGVVLTLGKLLTEAIDLDVLLRRLIDLICEAIGADRGTVYLVDRANEVLRSRVAHLDEIREIVLDLGQGIAGTVAESGEIVTIADARSDPRVAHEIDEQTGYETRSMLTAPIQDRGGEVIGVIQLLNKASGRFTEEDEAFVEALAAQAAMVIQNTSLYQQLKTRAPGGPSAPTTRLRYRFNHVVGSCEAMERVYDAVAKAAPTDATILIRGETGTGKDLIARAVHANSDRAERPFVKVDCAALPETLLENELFGHEKGAFTGADRRAPGKVEQAADGTLFIDEISELPYSVQGKLLRILQDREYEMLGGTETKEVEARIVAATNRDLEALVADGAFRDDLYYRIKVVQVEVPPLRARGRDDILELAAYFLDRYRRQYRPDLEMAFTDEAVDALADHDWPGNVRELEHCVEAAVVLADDPAIEPGDLPLPGGGGPVPGGRSSDPFADRPTLEELERRYIRWVLEQVGGTRTEAAEILDIGRNTLWRKIKKWDMEV